jgi:hypothetical protein
MEVPDLMWANQAQVYLATEALPPPLARRFCDLIEFRRDAPVFGDRCAAAGVARAPRPPGWPPDTFRAAYRVGDEYVVVWTEFHDMFDTQASATFLLGTPGRAPTEVDDRDARRLQTAQTMDCLIDLYPPPV